MKPEAVVVWEARLDGVYDCRVVRTDEPYQGVLEIWQSDTKLFSKPVSLAFDALFGPEVDDVISWEDAIIAFIDGGAN